jgi:hypothetical protein
MRKYLLASTLLAGLLSSHAALAVCQGGSGYPFNCTNAVAGPGTNDIVGGGVTSGLQNGQSVRWTWGQVFTGTTLTSPIIINGTINSLNAPLAGLYGGTGVANSGDTITLGGNISTAGAFTISGAFPLTFTLTGSTNITLPTSGTFLSNALANGDLWIGNGSGIATPVALTGDVTTTNAGATTVAKVGGVSLSLGAATALGVASSTVGAGTYYAGHSLIGVQVFSSGATVYTPDAGTNQVVLEVQAPGGGSGGCAGTSSSQSCVSGSGGAGAYAKALCTSGYSGITMTIGAVGAAGTAGSNAGGTGTTTTAGSLISAPGGIGGPAGGASNATTFTINVNGSTSTAAPTVSGCTALELVAGVGSGNGFILGIGAGLQLAGNGGSSILGRGPSLLNTSTTTNGASGTGYGWGAGGAINDLSQSGIAGLAGGPGRIIVWEYN